MIMFCMNANQKYFIIMSCLNSKIIWQKAVKWKILEEAEQDCYG